MDDSKLLPPLPIPFGRLHHRDVYSDEEMHEYARAAIAVASKWPATSINTEEFRKLVAAYMKYADSPNMTSGHYAWSQLINHIDAKMKALNIAPIPAADHQETGREQDKIDAERYRWLRMRDWFDGPLCVLRNPKKVLTDGRGLGADCPSRDRLDNAIDAAILAKKEGVQ